MASQVEDRKETKYAHLNPVHSSLQWPLKPREFLCENLDDDWVSDTHQLPYSEILGGNLISAGNVELFPPH